MKYKYRKKKRYWSSKKDSIWLTCNEEEKNRVEKSAKLKFDFEPIEKPKPIQGMVEEESPKKGKKNDK